MADEKKDVMIVVRVPSALRDKVNRKAEAKRVDEPGFTVAAMLRKSLESWVAKK